MRKRRKKNTISSKRLDRGYVDYLVFGIVVFAALMAGSLLTLYPTSNNTPYILVSPTPYGDYKSLQLHNLNFITPSPTPTPTKPPEAPCIEINPNFVPPGGSGGGGGGPLPPPNGGGGHPKPC